MRSSFFAKSSPDKSSKEINVPAAFKKLKDTVKLSNSEFHSSVDSALKKKKNSPGRPSPFSVCINLSVKAAVDKLRGMDFYEPYFLTDKAMGIDGFAESISTPFLSAKSRATYRARFRNAMASGIDKMCIHFYGKMYSAGNGNPDCIFVWKVPAVHPSQHAVKVAMAIDKCREMAPKQMSQEAVRHYNNIMDNVSIDIPAGAKVALRNYIFCGDPTPEECIADEYVKFVQDMAAGQASLYYLHMLVPMFLFVFNFSTCADTNSSSSLLSTANQCVFVG